MARSPLQRCFPPAADLSVRLSEAPDPVRVRERLTYSERKGHQLGPLRDAAHLIVNSRAGCA